MSVKRELPHPPQGRKSQGSAAHNLLASHPPEILDLELDILNHKLGISLSYSSPQAKVPAGELIISSLKN